jgi:hypothetical protein
MEFEEKREKTFERKITMELETTEDKQITKIISKEHEK